MRRCVWKCVVNVTIVPNGTKCSTIWLSGEGMKLKIRNILRSLQVRSFKI